MITIDILMGGFIDTAAWVTQTVTSGRLTDLIPISNLIFADRPFPISMASMRRKNIANEFDELVDDITDEHPELSRDECSDIVFRSLTMSWDYKKMTLFSTEMERVILERCGVEISRPRDVIRSFLKEGVTQDVDLIDHVKNIIGRLAEGSFELPVEEGHHVYVAPLIELIGIFCFSTSIADDVLGPIGGVDTRVLRDKFESVPRDVTYNKFVIGHMIGVDLKAKRDEKKLKRRLKELGPELATLLLTFLNKKR